MLHILLTLSLAGCSSPEETGGEEASGAHKEVVIYTALDQIYSEPILKAFEKKTGIHVRPVYDSEAAKTTGLVSRLVAERERPRCDVFWNNEIARTIRLKDEGLLDAYKSPGSEAIPASFKDPEGYWTGFAARARVLVYNTHLKAFDSEFPSIISVTDIQLMTGKAYQGRLGMAYPLFGTTSTHAAVLFNEWGSEKARVFFEALKANDVKIFEGNMSVCRAVADGEIPLGMADTDDAMLLISQGEPIRFMLIDHGGQGGLLVPNTVSLVKGAPNATAGRALIDYLLTPEVEAALAACPSAQIPLHPGVEAPEAVRTLADMQYMPVDFAGAAGKIPESAEFLKGLFTRP